eukprot:353830-Chlamydomonas_euryale.AAC.7
MHLCNTQYICNTQYTCTRHGHHCQQACLAARLRVHVRKCLCASEGATTGRQQELFCQAAAARASATSLQSATRVLMPYLLHSVRSSKDCAFVTACSRVVATPSTAMPCAGTLAPSLGSAVSSAPKLLKSISRSCTAEGSEAPGRIASSGIIRVVDAFQLAPASIR